MVEEPIADYQAPLPSESKDSRPLFLFNYPNTQGLPERDEMFFKTILSSVNLTLEDVKIVNIAGNSSSEISMLVNNPNAKKVVIFDLSTGIPQHYRTPGKVVKSGERHILPAWSLVEIAADKSKKAYLWHGLKQIFGIQ